MTERDYTHPDMGGRFRSHVARFLGLRASLNLPDGQMQDTELSLVFRQIASDPVTGGEIKTDFFPTYTGRAIESEEKDEYLMRGWSVQDEEGYTYAQRMNLIPVIVDEYGVETCHEPTEEQVKQLAEATGEDDVILDFEASSYYRSLAREGEQIIETANDRNFQDEQEIAQLFKRDAKEIAKEVESDTVRYKRQLSHWMSLVLFRSYFPEPDREVKISEQGGYDE